MRRMLRLFRVVRQGFTKIPDHRSEGCYLLALDGTTKNDCERTAANRLVAKLRQDHPHLKLIVTEDSLSANAPHIETLHAHQLHYILGVKEGDHAFLFAHIRRAEQAGQVTWHEQKEPGTAIVHRFRFVNLVPLNASHPELLVNHGPRL